MQGRLVSFIDDDDIEENSIYVIAKKQFELFDEVSSTRSICILSIVTIVAKDTATDGIRRLVRISQSIHKSLRVSSEKPQIFARNFQGLVKQYLNMYSSADGEREGQMFAILLLENAKLPASTFKNIVTQLITKSAGKQDKQKFSTITFPGSTLTDLLSMNTTASKAISSWEAAITTASTAHTLQTHKIYCIRKH